jgi:hypothetical protein
MNQKFIGAAALLVTSMLAGQADAAVTIDIQQVGADIVATASGTFDRAGAVFRGRSSGYGENLAPYIQYIALGQFAPNTYYAASGLQWLNPAAAPTYWWSTAGTTLFLNQDNGAFGIADSYVDGTQLSATATATGTSFAAAGLIAGSYAFLVGSNRVTINVGTVPAVPEPASWAMMLAGCAMTGAAMRYRRRRTVVTVAA